MTESQNDAVRAEETETLTKTKNGVVLFGKYSLLELLGVGACGKVYHATRVDTGQSVAVKSVSKHKVLSTNFAANVEREITIMRRLNHRHVITLHEVLATKTKIHFIMEFAAGGELFNLVAGKGHLTENLARKYFRQLISAVKHCHSQCVFHRDLKLDNLLLDENGNLKVSDFGLSAVSGSGQIRPDGMLHTVCGTPAYVAPEILAKKGYDGAKVDIWSCGVVLFALTAGYLPFNDHNITVLYRKIYRGLFRVPKWVSRELRNLLLRLLDVNPQTRITVDEILRDPWFNSGGFRPDPVEPGLVKEIEGDEGRTGEKCLNAFHLISFSTGLDLSGLFVNSDGSDSVERVVLREKPGRVVERVEEVAKEERVIVVRLENGHGVRLQGQDGNLVGLVVVYRLMDELVVVEMRRKEKEGDSCQRLWKDKLRPQLLQLALKREVPVFR